MMILSVKQNKVGGTQTKYEQFYINGFLFR